MFNENLKALRKQKGYSQEQLAIKLNVVRQTVSKWEKGLSVPDVEMLQNIADILEVNISQLLDNAMPETEINDNKVAEQLGRIAEQMAIKNQRSKRIWKVVKGVLIGVLVVVLISTIIAILGYSFINNSHSDDVAEIVYSYELDGELYEYRVTYNAVDEILSVEAPEDKDFNANDYNDLNEFSEALQEHLEDIGATDITETN